MTDEQIKQNADAYADKLYEDGRCTESTAPTIQDIYIAGAHSRDEEISLLNKEADMLLAAYKKLRHPWISVEERLPEKAIGKSERSEYVLCRHKNGSYYVAYWHVGLEYWYSMPYKIDKSNITHWMPIPELKKGDKQ